MRSSWTRGAWGVGLAAAVAACGSSVNQSGTGGAGGAGGGTTGSGGEGGEIPPACAVETSDPGPYKVTFEIENSGAFPAFLRQDCQLEYTILSCADGYTEPVTTRVSCSQACGTPGGGCIACGACPLNGLPVDVGEQITESWDGLRYTFGMTPDGCSCHEEHVARAGRYRIEVPVYASEMAVQDGAPSYQVTVNFELPAPNGVVLVPIGQSP